VPTGHVNDILESQFQNKDDIEVEATNQTKSTSETKELVGGIEF
jgi:hypothetical protein